jgi:hypothetical protein
MPFAVWADQHWCKRKTKSWPQIIKTAPPSITSTTCCYMSPTFPLFQPITTLQIAHAQDRHVDGPVQWVCKQGHSSRLGILTQHHIALPSSEQS